MHLTSTFAALGGALLLCFLPACSTTEQPTETNTTGTTGGPGGTGGSGGSGSGGSSSQGSGAGDVGPTPGADAVVTPFDQTHVYFVGYDGNDNQRSVDATATFPEGGAYERITLHLSLTCPQGGCDSWDRFASLGLVSEKGQNGEPDKVIEIARYITPFKAKAAWDIDVTDLRPLLSGEVTLRAFIDTWVGPGSPYGAGWLVTASFEMKGGLPARLPIAVLPVWTPTYVPYGDPAKPIAGSVPPHDMMLPEASSYALRTFVTGHGQGNAGNCAEFCKRTHTLQVGAAVHPQQVWRSDCATTGAPGQQGTWKYSRAGWCPGADVLPWTVDITPDVSGVSSVSVAYAVDDYDNTCRPDAPTCTGCTLGTGCEYDGGAHTEPNYQLSTLLIAYQ